MYDNDIFTDCPLEEMLDLKGRYNLDDDYLRVNREGLFKSKEYHNCNLDRSVKVRIEPLSDELNEELYNIVYKDCIELYSRSTEEAYIDDLERPIEYCHDVSTDRNVDYRRLFDELNDEGKVNSKWIFLICSVVLMNLHSYGSILLDKFSCTSAEHPSRDISPSVKGDYRLVRLIVVFSLVGVFYYLISLVISKRVGEF